MPNIEFDTNNSNFTKIKVIGAEALFLPAEVACSIFSSTRVFHSPQEGHFPIHFAHSYPQALHTNLVVGFAIYIVHLCILYNVSRIVIAAGNIIP